MRPKQVRGRCASCSCAYDGDADQLLFDLRRGAARYYEVRGRPLGITNAMGELAVAGALGIELVMERADHDGIGRDGALLCIRARVVQDATDIGLICVNGIRFDATWDAVLLALLDRHYELIAIYRADRLDLEAVVRGPRFGKETNRHALSINTFRKVGTMVWSVGPRLSV